MSLFRPNIERMQGYVPGEQPQDAGWIKLNTNENPYPPSPKVVEAIREAAASRLNLYPDPLGTKFREAAGRVFGLDPEWIIPTNGSDEVLTIITRAFAGEHDRIAYPYPSYVLYETLAELQAAPVERIPLNRDWSWNDEAVNRIVPGCKLLFVPNPNSPSGNRWSDEQILSVVPPNGMLILDEAYGDFADKPHRAELLRGEHGKRIIVTRTFSKSYSLAGIRFGFGMAHPDVIDGLRKVKDSYNCDAVSLAAATAAMEDQAWMLENTRRIRATRARLMTALADLGFDPAPSEANFIWATHPTRSHREIYEALKERRILVRYMRFPHVDWRAPDVFDGLRTTIGTDAEIDTLIDALRAIV